MQTYSEYAPTPFDHAGAFLPDQGKWLVAPVMQTRDSGPMACSNFASTERKLLRVDPDGKDHENHRFGHWGPGWFEILVVRPGTTCADIAESIESALADYPILDDNDFSEREFKEACEAWYWTSIKDRIEILTRHDLSIFAARRDEIPQGLPYFDDFYTPQG